MAESSGERLPGSSEVCRTFSRSDEVRVNESSPRKPYLSFTIGPHPLLRLVIKIWSHDQGWCSDQYNPDQPYAGSYTWFALGILPKSSDPLRPADEPDLCDIQSNVRASSRTKCHTLDWRFDMPFEGDQLDNNDPRVWLQSISSGSCVEVGVFPLAKYRFWVNYVSQVKVELYEDINTTLSPATGPDFNTAASQTTDTTATATGSTFLTRRIEDVHDVSSSHAPNDNHDALASYLQNLTICLGGQYEPGRPQVDLDTAIEMAEQAIAITPGNHPGFAGACGDLGRWLIRKFDRTGSMDILARAIEFNQKAVEATQHNNPTYAIFLHSLGESLGRRYQRTGSVDDLTRATEAFVKATSAPKGHPSRKQFFINLAICLKLRHAENGSPDDLTGAIKAAETAIEMAPQKHKDFSLLTLHSDLRYKQTGALDDLTRQIEVYREAAEASHGAQMACYLNNVGVSLLQRHQRTGSMDDLTDAIETAQRAVEATPPDHTYLAMFLAKLGHALGCHCAQTHKKADEDAQISAYVRAGHCTTAPPIERMRYAAYAVDILVTRDDWDRAYALTREAVLLLPRVNQRFLKQSDMQTMVIRTSSFATNTAALAINAGEAVSEALSILELGRGIIAGLSIDTRSDLSDLMETHPSLAEKFDSVRKELDSPIPDNGSMAELSMVNRRHQASRDFDEIIEQIRAQEGFRDFLQQPTKESLMAAAKSGPIVVINVSTYRCDAILVERHTIRLLELPALTLKEVQKYARDINTFKRDPWSLLEWLWTTICRPCLDALGFTEPLGENDRQWPHLWWVPTGPLSQLPLHAAGIYTTPASKETVLDRVVSSYASSLKALQHGRRKRTGMVDEHTERSDAVLVAMEETKGQSSLPDARKEIDTIRALCPLLHLNVTMPSPHKADILGHLKHCKVLHFAGHGESRSDPSESLLLLDDWKTDPLTVSDLRESWLQESPAFLAYLSACSTGSNKGLGLADEAIHLVSAFHLAGFRHVIGTLWEVSDPHCVDVAAVLYQTLCDEGMTDEAVSHGLHRAVRKLRNDCFREGGWRAVFLVEDEGQMPGSSAYTYWIPYIHFGA